METVKTETVQMESSPAQKMELCSRHGKKRQVEYLEKCADSDEWMCKDSELCKMSMKPSKKEKEMAFILAKSSAVEGKKADQCPAIQVSGASVQREPIPLYSPDIITSWADEVDKEFPLGEIEPENKPELTSSFNTLPINPSPCVPSRATSESPTGLLNRVGQLEDELTHTKQKLSKTKEEMNRALRNERILESKLRSLCSEISRMRQERAQYGVYALTSPDSRHAMVPDPRYNGDLYAVPEPFDGTGSSHSGVLSPQYIDSARSSIDGGSAPATAMNSARSVQFCQPINPRIEMARTVPLYTESARSSFVDSARTTAASIRSSMYSYGTPYSTASFDSEHFNGR